jgi:sigma-B regulation protein RsbU (phosphoserine phosphatase)
MLAARELGGDFYDIIEIDRNRIGIIIADVSGKGVSAALFMAVSCTIMKSTALRGGGPGEVLEQVNNVLAQENESSMFVTLFYGIIDIRNNGLSYANAGHNPPYLMHSDKTVTAIECTGGVALGVLTGCDTPKRASRCKQATRFAVTPMA